MLSMRGWALPKVFSRRERVPDIENSKTVNDWAKASLRGLGLSDFKSMDGYYYISDTAKFYVRAASSGEPRGRVFQEKGAVRYFSNYSELDKAISEIKLADRLKYDQARHVIKRNGGHLFWRYLHDLICTVEKIHASQQLGF